MLAEVYISQVVLSVLLVAVGLIFLGMVRDKEVKSSAAKIILSVLCAFCFVASFSSGFSFNIFGPRTFIKEASPGVWFADDGKVYDVANFGITISKEKNIPVVYQIGNPDDSGYTVRWWRLVKVEYTFDKYDYRAASRQLVLYRTKEKAVAMSDGDNPRIINLPDKLEIATINECADAYWRQTHPGQTEGEFEMLVYPVGEGQPRIEKWVFN